MSGLRFAAWRVVLGLITLWLLSVIVFAAARVLPGDVGRAILGPLADARAVAALDHALGADRGALASYIEWSRGLLQGDFGVSYAYRTPVAPLVAVALGRSLRLACLILAVAVPPALAAGLTAAHFAGGRIDRLLTLGGLALTVVPEFVTAILAMLVFGIALRWLPISAEPPPGAGAGTWLRHLILPALPGAVALFGYLARTLREASLAALQSDYLRAAILKGLAWPAILVRHLLPNVLPLLLTVLAAQLSYLLGGLVVVETLFRYPGIGLLILSAGRAHDFPLLQASVLVLGAFVVAASLAADLAVRWLTPRAA